MNKIAERAGALGLFATANALADTKIDPKLAPIDARLVEPPATDIKRILGQMVRRGSDQKLVAALWAKLDGRPLERALVAVDVLAQGIWSQRDPLLEELRAAATSLGTARTLGELGIDLNQHTARELIERYARPEMARASSVELLALAYDQHLGVLDELLKRKDELLTQLPTRESIHAFARLASMARLPTLASVYFDWLVRGLGWRVPVLDLCETMFDAGIAQKIPGDAIQPDDVPERDRRDVADYLVYRSHLGVGDSDTANALLVKTMAERPRWSGSPSTQVEVVRAHLGILYGHSKEVSLARIEAACSQDRLWRYAAQVRAIVAAARAPHRAFDLFHGYLVGFGNDYDMTLAVISLAPEDVKRDVARVLCREAFYLPHEPAPWKLLGALHSEGAPIANEIDLHLRGQLA
jgi:hypothetical protein